MALFTHKLPSIALVLILVFLGMMIVPFSQIQMVNASEEEETDNFSIMPNYRWENETTTSNTEEQLLGGNYEINASNGGTFAKSRPLNSRDLEIESRFGLDLGAVNYSRSPLLIYYLQFNESDGGTGETYDSSIYERNIVETWTNGNFNASSFNEEADNSIFINETYFDVNDPNEDLIAENFSVGCWIYLTSYPQEEDSIILGRRRNFWSYGVRNYSLTSYVPKFYFKTSSEEGAGYSIYSNTIPNLNQWYFITATYNNGTNEGNIYLNGALDNSGTMYYRQHDGGSYNGTVGDFYGDITLYYDECFYYNSTLSSSFITSINTSISVLVDEIYTSGTRGQFKFSLLNQQKEEGLYFSFSRDNDLTIEYNFSVVLKAEIGTDLSYSTLFYYNMTIDGWLYFDLKTDLDEKEIQLQLQYENKTRLINVRSWYDLFGITGTQSFLLLKAGFPELCINATQETSGQAWIIIDYIDANYRFNTFVAPDAGYFLGLGPQGASNAFTSEHHLGVLASNLSVDNVWRLYYVDIDRFDGVSFSWNMETFGGDAGDKIYFYNILYNVQSDGQLIKVLEQQVKLGIGAGSIIDINNRTGLLNRVNTGTIINAEYEGAVSYALRDSEEVIMQSKTHHVNIEKTYEASFVARDASYNYTNEFVLMFCYNIYNSFSGADDDQFSIVVSGFNTIRKDILSDLVGNILTPIADFFISLIQFIFTPIIIILMFIGKLITDGLVALGEFLKPLFDTLANLFDEMLGWLSDILDDIGALVEGIGNFILTLIDDFLAAAIPFLLTLIEGIVDVITGIVFWLWDFGGEPGDGLFDFLGLLNEIIVYGVAFIASMITWIIKLAELFDFFVILPLFMLGGWWGWQFINAALDAATPLDFPLNIISNMFNSRLKTSIVIGIDVPLVIIMFPATLLALGV